MSATVVLRVARNGGLGAAVRIGEQVWFAWRTFACLPLALTHYRAQVGRVIAESASAAASSSWVAVWSESSC